MADASDQEILSDDENMSQSQSGRKKKYKLQFGATMKVTGIGPMDQTGDIKLKMEWSVPSRNIHNKEIVINWDDNAAKRAKDVLWKKLQGPVFLESANQARDFPLFLGREILDFEAERNESGLFSTSKPIKEFDEVSLLDVDNILYLVAGRQKIFLLGQSDNWARELSSQELEDLPFDIYWTGRETNFEVDSRRATELIFKIVSNLNKTQESEWYSFPMFSLFASISGFLYVPKLKRVGNFMTFMTISGEGYSTGKSLLADACMLALYGSKLDCTAPTTVPKLYDMLGSGRPIYVREWSDDLWKMLVNGVPGIWEANGKSVKNANKIPKTTMFLSANLTAADVEKKLSPAIRSKITLIHTGEKSLHHEEVTELCSGLLDTAKLLYKYLPSVLGLGVQTLLTKATGADIKTYSGELRKENDIRETQVLKDYDALYKLLLDKGLKHGLELPPLFQKEFIDHGSVTSNNKSKEDTRTNLNAVLTFLDQANLFDILVPASRDSKGQGGYKLNANDPRIPSDIKVALTKCTETFVTKLRHKTVRLRFLASGQLDTAVAKKVEAKVAAAQNTYDNWAKRVLEESTYKLQNLRRKFSTCISRLGYTRTADPIDEIELSTTQSTSERTVKIVAVGGSGASGSGISVRSRATATLSSGSRTSASKAQAPVSSSQAEDYESEDLRTCTVRGCKTQNKVYKTVKCYKAHEKTDTHRSAVKKNLTQVSKKRKRENVDSLI